ncbi:unnamed protein product [Cyclocybe aegerita]|uniref:F-box domain-containing protein n=1 Tax=Cyclocybe aegerita TaxID=1973307 RepID=A0A8S0XG04_CYCAE|nr:unnamed protein product [Cyclocybe aegerita]
MEFTDAGRQEIVGRTGHAPLSIFGNIASIEARKLVGELLHMSWTRIRRLEIVIRTNLFDADSENWATMYTAAPSLEEFRLAFMSKCDYPGEELDDDEEEDEDEEGPSLHRPPGLFAGDAPRMRSFSCPSWLDIDPSASWPANLRHLSVGEEGEGKVPLSKVLKMLSRIRHLESLELSTRNFDVGQDLHSLPVIHVPNLIDLVLYFEDIVKNAIVLKHIVSAPGCAIEVNMISPLYARLGRTGDQDLIKTVLASHTENWFNSNLANKPELLELNIFKGYINVTQDVAPIAGSRARCFILSVLVIQQEFISGMLFVLNAFSSCDFTHITTLELQIGQTHHWIDPNVQAFVFSFLNVRTLNTDYNTIKAMSPDDVAGSPSNRIPFPKLATIQLHSHVRVFRSAEDVQVTAEHSWKRFFGSRARAGCPVQVLDLTKSLGPRRADLTALEGISGLNVRWMSRDGEQVNYICGSSDLSLLSDWLA